MSGVRMLWLLSRAEGASLLALVFVAMPLKYGFDLPLAVRIVGMLHGVLFLALLSTGARVWMEKAAPVGRIARVLVWCLVPFGFLVVDRELREDLVRIERG